MSIQPPIVVKNYTGSRSSVARQYQNDMSFMVTQGYRIESQQLIPGRRGGCLMILLAIMTVGMSLLIRPRDTLVVTYRLESPNASPS